MKGTWVWMTQLSLTKETEKEVQGDVGDKGESEEVGEEEVEKREGGSMRSLN